MLRERVTTQSQGATAVGWISLADGVFFVLILTLAAAIAVQVSLTQTESANATLQSTSDSLTAELQATRERASRLEQEREELFSKNVALKSLLDDERQLAATLRKERDALRASNLKLAAQIEQLNRNVMDHEQLLTRLEELQQELERLGVVEMECKRLSKLIATYKATIQRLLKEQAERQGRVAEYMSVEKRELEAKLALATTRVKELERKLRATASGQPAVHKELLGLRGDFNRVAILFDISQSMEREGRWTDALRVVETLLNHLEVQECTLILFSSTVREIPGENEFLKMQGTEGEENRERLLSQLRLIKPNGQTKTLLALEAAYKYPELDTILLLTDGEPTGDSGRFDAATAKKVYDLCKQHHDIPINAVGLGNYFKPELSSFLLRVAEESGGTYRGR